MRVPPARLSGACDALAHQCNTRPLACEIGLARERKQKLLFVELHGRAARPRIPAPARIYFFEPEEPPPRHGGCGRCEAASAFAPLAPGAPGLPGAPGEADPPGAPCAPGLPGAPLAPVGPVCPAAPRTPSVPAAPAGPLPAVGPRGPATPVCPDNPGGPAGPATPLAPGGPVVQLVRDCNCQSSKGGRECGHARSDHTQAH